MSDNISFESDKAEEFLEDLEAFKQLLKEDIEELTSSWERLQDSWDDSHLDEFESIFVQGCLAILQEASGASAKSVAQLEEQLAIAQKLNQLSFDPSSSRGASSRSQQGTALTPATINSLQKATLNKLIWLQLWKEAKIVGQKSWTTGQRGFAAWQLFTLISSPMIGGTMPTNVDVSSPAPAVGNASPQGSKNQQVKGVRKAVGVVQKAMKGQQERERDKRKREAEITAEAQRRRDSTPSSF